MKILFKLKKKKESKKEGKENFNRNTGRVFSSLSLHKIDELSWHSSIYTNIFDKFKPSPILNISLTFPSYILPYNFKYTRKKGRKKKNTISNYEQLYTTN